MSGGRDWTTSEVRRLHEMRALGFKAWAIAQELGRTEDAIYSFVRYAPAGKGKPKGKQPAIPTIHGWSEAEVRKLREIADDGATAVEAARELCRPLYAVRCKASREGISFGKARRDSTYKLEREGKNFNRNAAQGSAQLLDALKRAQA